MKNSQDNGVVCGAYEGNGEDWQVSRKSCIKPKGKIKSFLWRNDFASIGKEAVFDNHRLQARQQTAYIGTHEEIIMPKYVIEREIPGAGDLSPQQLQSISQTSCGVISSMGPQVQWLQSYVTDDIIYCVYIAPDEEAVREHARQGGFPANKVSKVATMIDPTTAE